MEGRIYFLASKKNLKNGRFFCSDLFGLKQEGVNVEEI